MAVNHSVPFLNAVLWSVSSALCVSPGKCSVSVHSTHFWCTVWKVFCFCSKYTFLMYGMESVLFLCTVHFSVVPSGKCFVSVHSTLFWYTVMKSVLFLCTVHISDAQCDIYVIDFSFRFGFVHTASLWIYREEDSSNPCLNLTLYSFPYECDRYGIFGSHPC